MKKILALVFAAVLISLLIIPAGTALADQDFHTIRLPLTLTQEGEDAGHTLRNGMWIRTHAEGPINCLILSVILNGAKPNTTYDICWDISGGSLPPNVTIYNGESFQTDKLGNANFHFSVSPDLNRERAYPNTTLVLKVVLIEGGTGTVVDLGLPGGMLLMFGGTHVFETGWFDVNLDWDW